MTDHDAFRILSRELAGRLLCALAIFAGFLLSAPHARAHESDVRFEIAAGNCKHRLAQDASWSYREKGDYETNMRLDPDCHQLGASWMPKWSGLGDLRLGVRGAYVHLGRIEADNTFPLNEPEYFRAKEEGGPVNSETSRFTGHGSSQGFTLGLASEYPVWKFHVGAEVGAALLYSSWKAFFKNGEEQIYGCGAGWRCADGWHWTPYVGASARYEWLQISWRRYMNAHASDATQNPLFIGPTTGPVDQMLIGLSIPW